MSGVNASYLSGTFLSISSGTHALPRKVASFSIPLDHTIGPPSGVKASCKDPSLDRVYKDRQRQERFDTNDYYYNFEEYPIRDCIIVVRVFPYSSKGTPCLLIRAWFDTTTHQKSPSTVEIFNNISRRSE